MLKSIYILMLSLVLLNCGGSDDVAATSEPTVWDDGDLSSNVLIWDDGSAADNMKWAD